MSDPKTPSDAAKKTTEATEPAEDLPEAGGGATEEAGKPDLDWTPPFAPPEPPGPRARSGPGLLVMALGGLVAGAIGYAVSLYAPATQEPTTDPAVTELSRQLAEQDSRIAAIGEDIQTLNASINVLAERAADAQPPGPDPEVAARLRTLEETLASLSAGIAGLQGDLGGLGDRLAQIERAPAGDAATESTLARYEAELAALREELDRQRAENATLAAEVATAMAEAEARVAEAEARVAQIEAGARTATAEAERRTALSDLRDALDSGAPFDAALARLAEVSGQPVPPELEAIAGLGVPTLDDLEESFRPAARRAIEASLAATVDGDAIERMSAFLRAVTGARSLQPREGNDPDAILSRAEDALRRGDLAAALSEVEALPPEGKAAMSEWIAAARSRVDVESAVARLAAAASDN